MKYRTILIAGIIGLALAWSSVAVALDVQDLVDQVSQANYTHYLDDLLYTHLRDNRGFGKQHDVARTNIFNEFNSFGLTTSLHPFLYGGSTYYNVVGVHTGSVRTDDIYIVGAHYDSVDNPGADDNASGTAGVMEAARILAQYNFEATLIFIAFDREEQGLLGSKAYAQEHSGDNILGMISLDMIAYNNGLNKATIYGRTSSDPLKQALADSISTYGRGLTYELAGSLDASDHAPFEWEGFQACLLIEDWGNPYYHQPEDSVDTPNYIDYAFATNMVRSTVGYFATSAVIVIPEPGVILILGFGILLLSRKRRA